MQVIKPPQTFANVESPIVFLAGSIEMGLARDWQSELTELVGRTDVTYLNPRRDDWDSSWKQEASNPQFRGQVEWELDGLATATIIAMHFEPATKSPISLLELGLHASGGKLVVSCPEGYWRRGNVEVVCNRYGVPFCSSLQELANRVKVRLAGSL